MAKKVHITLVGGQPTPVFQGILYSNPDKVIYICSKQTIGKVNSIQKRLKAIQEKYKNKETTYIVPVFTESKSFVYDVEDVTGVTNAIQQLIDQEIDITQDQVSMNLSSGVKLWTMLFQKLAPKNTHIYCISQNGKVLTVLGNSNEVNENVAFSMFTQCELLDYPIESYTAFEEYKTQDKQDYATIEHLYQQDNFYKLLLKTIEEYLKYKTTHLQHDQYVGHDDAFIEYNKAQKQFSIFLNNKKYYVRGPHAASFLLEVGWLKYGIATLMAEIYGKENVYTNCTFKIKEDKIITIDVIVNTEHKLIFIACQPKKIDENTLASFSSNVRNCGGLGSKSLVTTMHYDKDSEDLCNKKDVKYCSMYYQDGKQITKKQLKEVLKSFINQANI